MIFDDLRFLPMYNLLLVPVLLLSFHSIFNQASYGRVAGEARSETDLIVEVSTNSFTCSGGNRRMPTRLMLTNNGIENIF